jgi:hypothetical protein
MAADTTSCFSASGKVGGKFPGTRVGLDEMKTIPMDRNRSPNATRPYFQTIFFCSLDFGVTPDQYHLWGIVPGNAIGSRKCGKAFHTYKAFKFLVLKF